MNPLFHPRLVNGSLGDPALYVEFKFSNRAILFDLGEIGSLSPRQILKISQVFVSHTHMDHFIGFDHFLRICLGRSKRVQMVGPPGFINQLRHRLAAYTWNLVAGYPCSLDLMVSEVHPDHVQKARLTSATAFAEASDQEIKPFDGLVYEENFFSVRCAILDHKIPCLAFVLEEKLHINILKTELEKRGLSKGPWLRELKEAIWRGEPDDYGIRTLGLEQGEGQKRLFPLEVLRRQVVKTTPGQKIGFVVDTVWNERTRKKIKQLVAGADILFIEAAFLEKDRQRASEKYHLTAHQAGSIAGQAGVKRLVPFHISPKYSSDPGLVIQEAYRAFKKNSLKKLSIAH